ncbi:hypothetical protein MUP79_00230 [Candidatus Bathyarchaeota archaeon]|nr:hypothetical protein [Candidatus Bathyarchaeota archaeon]
MRKCTILLILIFFAIILSITVSALTFTYDSNDLAPATINGVVTIIIILLRFAMVIFTIGFILWGLGKLGYEKFKGWKR